MAGDYGPAKSGFRLGVFATGTETRSGGSEGRVTGGVIRLKRPYTVVDTTNSLSVSGSGAVNDSWSNRNLSASGAGTADIVSFVGEWRPLTRGAKTTVYVQANLSAFDIVSGGTLTTDNVPFDLPVWPYDTPDVQTGVTVTRVSDTQQTISWTRHASTGAPYAKQYLYRRLGNGRWARIAEMSGTATSYADKSTVANAKYDYQLRAWNSSGYSSYSSTATISTSPAAPTNGSTSKSGTTITFKWTDNAAYETGFEVQESQDGGTYGPLGTPGANATQYVHTGASNLVTHRYRVRAVAGALTSGWLTSGIVSLLAPPNAPLVVLPGGGAVDVEADGFTIAWVHQAIDATEQTAAEMRWKPTGGSWTTETFTTQTSFAVPAGAWSNGVTYEVQARTKGGHADWSPWSASSVLTASTTPQVLIDYPADGSTVNDSGGYLSWVYFQAESSPQAAWEVEVIGPNSYESQTGSGASNTVTPTTRYNDGETYTVRVRAQSGDGLWSDWAENTFTVNFLPPPTAQVDATFDPDEGTVELAITVPGPEDGVEVAAVTVSVQRRDGDRWVTALDESPVPVEGVLSLIDRIPPLRPDVEYQITTTSATPSSATATVTVDCSGSCWLFLNAGPGWETVAKVWANLQPTYTPERTKTVRTFYGGTTKEYPGEARARTWQFAGDVATMPADEERIGTRDAWEAIADMPAPVCLRSPLGHRTFGSVSAVPQAFAQVHTAISGTLTETTYRE